MHFILYFLLLIKYYSEIVIIFFLMSLIMIFLMEKVYTAERDINDSSLIATYG